MDRYEVVVIGGGVIGLSVARELARAGIERIAVLEKEPSIGQGSSARANGGVRAQFTTAINIAFSRYSIAELERLDTETGGSVAFRQEGYLLFTADGGRAEQLRAACELQRSLDIDTRWLERDEIAEIAPFVRADGLIAGTFHSRDGFLDPHGLLTVFARDTKERGINIRTTSEVSSIEAASDGFELRLAHGSLVARRVVNAAGPHASLVAALLDIELPVHPIRRNMAFLHDEREPRRLIPMCVDLDTGVLIRREGLDGYLIAYSDPGDEPGWETSVDPRWLEDVSERIGDRFPHLRDVPIDPRHCWAGLYPETPDGHAVIGEAPEVRGFYECAGFGGHGLMHSPAAGKAIAELIVNGSCATFDLHPLRPSRFAEGDFVLERAVL